MKKSAAQLLICTGCVLGSMAIVSSHIPAVIYIKSPKAEVKVQSADEAFEQRYHLIMEATGTGETKTEWWKCYYDTRTGKIMELTSFGPWQEWNKRN